MVAEAEVVVMADAAKKNVPMAVAAAKAKAVADVVASQPNQIILKCCFRTSCFETTFLVYTNYVVAFLT